MIFLCVLFGGLLLGLSLAILAGLLDAFLDKKGWLTGQKKKQKP